MVIRALISDLDNTLYSPRSLPRSTLQPLSDALRTANRTSAILPEPHLEEALEACWERPFDEVARLYSLPKTLRRVWANAAEQLEVTEPLQPYPDVSVLWTLPLRLFLVTTGYRRFQLSKIAALGLTSRFEAIYIDAIEESTRPGKEGLFRLLLAKHQLTPDVVVVLGDNEGSEIAAGRRLGLRTIQILREGTGPAPTAEWQIRSFNDLPQVLADIAADRSPSQAPTSSSNISSSKPSI